MNTKKIIFLSILLIFIVGMTFAPASASHTFKVGKYKATVSDKQYNKLKKAKKNNGYYSVEVKTKNTYKIKKYKYKTVTKKKWKYKTVLDNEFVYYSTSDGGGSDYYDYHTMSKYTKKGWTWYGSYYKTYDYDDGSSATKYFYKFKKKVPVKVKVKTNKYTKVKKPYTMEISSDGDAWIYKGYNMVKIGTVKI